MVVLLGSVVSWLQFTDVALLENRGTAVASELRQTPLRVAT